jgi:hypothetical protein
MVEPFHCCLKDALLACYAAANWVDHLPWVLLCLCEAAGEDDSTTPAQAVFRSQLNLSCQFLDSPELLSKNFFEQLSKTLSAAKHPSTRHNTAAARQPPPKLQDDLARAPTVFSWRDGHVPLLQPLYDSPTLSFSTPCITSSCTSATGRTRCPPSGPNPALILPHQLCSPEPGAAHLPPSPSGVFPCRAPRQPAGYTLPHYRQGNRAGNRFPLARPTAVPASAIAWLARNH